jgi:hypothetical protein
LSAFLTRWLAMTDFIDRHAGTIVDVPSCLDRAVITAILPNISHAEAATRFFFNPNVHIYNRHPPGQAGRTAAVEGRVDVDDDPGRCEPGWSSIARTRSSRVRAPGREPRSRGRGP